MIATGLFLALVCSRSNLEPAPITAPTSAPAAPTPTPAALAPAPAAERGAERGVLRQQNLQQELDLIKKNNEWYETELKTKSAEHSKFRKEKSGIAWSGHHFPGIQDLELFLFSLHRTQPLWPERRFLRFRDTARRFRHFWLLR
jgi:hypothetical protein